MKRSVRNIVKAAQKRLRTIHHYPKRIMMNRWWLRLFPAPPIEIIATEWLEVINPGGKKAVLYIAPKYDYGDRSRGLSYEEHLFANCLANMHDITTYRLDLYDISAKYGRKVANAVLKEVALSWQFDQMLLLLYKDIFDREVLKFIRDAIKIKTTIWLFDDDKRFEDTKTLVPFFSEVITTLPNRHNYRCSIGINSKLCQYAANHYLYIDRDLDRDIDVIFIGQNFGNRQDYINFLNSNGINVKVYGGGWGTGRVSQSEMITLLGRSKIALNFSSSEGHPELKFLKGRVFEIPATGAMLLTEDCEYLENYFSIGNEAEVFSTKEDMLLKIQHYLSDNDRRIKVAKAGKKKVLECYTMETFLRMVV